jgi:ClpP class serine protease
MLHRLISILSAQWLIHQDTATTFLPLLLALTRGEKILPEFSASETPFILAFNGDTTLPVVGKSQLTDLSLEENSVAVLSLSGPICSWDSLELIRQLSQVEANDKINSVLLAVNSPGGMVNQTDILAEKIRSMTKPTVAVISGMAASAAMWIISAASLRIATSPMDLVGSVGTKVSIQDYSGLLEKIGIRVSDFYASKATRKDEEIRAIKSSGDTAPITAFVDYVNEIFHQAIRENLGIAADSEVFTGATFFASKALDLGLINEIGTGERALTYAYELGLKNKIISQSKYLNF